MVPSGAATYTFSSGSAIVSPNNTTTYSVTGTSSQGCVSSSAAIANVSVSAQPTINATSSASLICVGQSATLTANGAASYTWNTVGSGISIAVSPTVITSYTVTGTDANGCNNSAVITQSVDACTVINETKSNLSLIEIYPNPANELLNINLGSLDTLTVKIQLVNSIGQIVLSRNAERNQIQLNLSQLENGIYFVKIYTNNESINHKLIKN
jgi:hypothetical protein